MAEDAYREASNDPRVHFAAERTLLAWVRTGLAMMGFGFVVAESLTSGTPVVAPDAGGVPALLDPACSELYPPTATIQEIADRIDRLLARDRTALSAAAIRAAETLLTMDQHFDALFELYDRLRRSPDPRAAVV